LARAVAEATKARAELIDGEALDEFLLEIMDESGRVLAKVG
jgi:restriction endonuclease Mrr